MTFAIGENVGAYRITDRLGQGGMATVYRAYHAKLNRYVAIKVMHPAFKEDADFLSRFQREAQIVAALEHPNIVPVYDYSEFNGQPYLVMKFIEGMTLKARVNDKPMTIDSVVQIMTAVGYALTYAHNMGILHRDIKPSNILLETGTDHPYLADFGLARIAGAGESTMSQDMMLGTPQYMSPEQAQGVRDLDAGTDIYSLGVIMYEMLVGRVPFNADTPYAIVHDHIYTPLPLPSKINPQIPPSVEAVLLKGLAKDRMDRYATAAEMVDAFRTAVEESGMVAAKFTVGNYRVGPNPGQLAKSVNSAPNTLSVPTNLSGIEITGPNTGSNTPPLPPLPSSATAILPDRTPLPTPPLTPLPIGVPGVIPSSVAAAAHMTLPESVAELRRRQHRRQRQSQLWIFGGFAGLVVTLLAGLLIGTTIVADPSLRLGAVVTASVRPPPNTNKPPATNKPTGIATASTSIAAIPTGALTPVSTQAATATDLPDVSIPDLSEAEAQALTQQDAKNPVNWFALALAQIKNRKVLPGPNATRIQNIQNAFETGYTLAVNNPPVLFSAGKVFDSNKVQSLAIYLYTKVLTVPGLSSSDHNYLLQRLFVLAHSAGVGEQATFSKTTIDFASFIDAYIFASIAATSVNHLPDAQGYLDKAISMNPTFWGIHLARGILLSAQNQPDLAYNEYKEALSSREAASALTNEITVLEDQAAATLIATAAATGAQTSSTVSASPSPTN